MKKLMFALAAASLVGLVHAAQANWKYTANNIYNGAGETGATKYTGNAYIFNAGTVSQEDIFIAFKGNYLSFDITQQEGYLANGTAENGIIAASKNTFSAFEQGSGAHNFFFVLIDGDKMYLSSTKNDVFAGTTDTAVGIAFGNQGANSKLSDFGYQGTGTWSVVPEPTSGLMILLGLAGLALRRKQA